MFSKNIGMFSTPKQYFMSYGSTVMCENKGENILEKWYFSGYFISHNHFRIYNVESLKLVS